MDILEKHFPGRSVTMSFIHKLREWVMSHNDAIRGEDLIAEINFFEDFLIEIPIVKNALSLGRAFQTSNLKKTLLSISWP